MATIERRQGKRGVRYRALVRKRGHVESASFKRKTDAERWATGIEAKIDEGSYFPTSEARKRTLAELCERYIRDYVPQLRSGGERVRHLEWWVEQLGSRKLADLTPAVLAEKRDELARGQKSRGEGKRAAGTVNRYLAALSHAFTLAVKEWGWLDQNPMAKVARKKEPRGRVRFLDDDERKRLLEAAKASDESRLHVLLVLSLATGLRQGEAMALRWKDMDLEKGVAVIHETKNDERRSVPLSPTVVRVLRKHGKVRPLDRDALVFADEPGGGSSRFPRAAWEQALQVAEVKNFKWHDTRHCAASALAQSGASLLEIAHVLGHKTLQMVARYSHLTHQTTAAAIERANAAMFEGME